MTKRMLIDATHDEEIRVAVIDGNRLEEFDYESAVRKQLKGNVFLAKVTRVEPSLQAAFVDFGGNRHGFLPFSEIHPDYYRIPIADREALIAEEEAYMKAQEALLEAEEREEEEKELRRLNQQSRRKSDGNQDDEEGRGVEADLEHSKIDTLRGFSPDDVEHDDFMSSFEDAIISELASAAVDLDDTAAQDDKAVSKRTRRPARSVKKQAVKKNDVTDEAAIVAIPDPAEESEEKPKAKRGRKPKAIPTSQAASIDHSVIREKADDDDLDDLDDSDFDDSDGLNDETTDGVEVNEGDAENTQAERPAARRSRRSRNGRQNNNNSSNHGDDHASLKPPSIRKRYKIQEVIKRGQIMLIQVSKEERGNKGAAVTSYLSLPGRYCVLMPNSTRGGGVSRKIASYNDRKRMREILKDLQIPDGMSVILRTAGLSRSKAEIKRDLEYLIRLWDNIRSKTLASTAPALINEEGNLEHRAIRDLYTRDIEDVYVAGEEAYKHVKEFMKILIPSHAKKVKEYHDAHIPLFHRYQIENQIMEMNSPVANLKSGGYLVINQTEALVAVDVNSGRSTRERHIDDTALRTNLEAADEVARQLRLRDLGGLVVIDFIDMEDFRHNAKVERRLRDALSKDRARIQVGRISNFGLLELSRQRLNPSLTEAQYEVCHHCAGTGTLRTPDSAAIMILRSLIEEGIKGRASEVKISIHPDVAAYILNYKRDMLSDIEKRYAMRVYIHADETQQRATYLIDVLATQIAGQGAANDVAIKKRIDAVTVEAQDLDDDLEDEDESQDTQQRSQSEQGGDESQGENVRRRRNRRRNGRRNNRDRAPNQAETLAEGVEARDENDSLTQDDSVSAVMDAESPSDKRPSKRRNNNRRQNSSKPQIQPEVESTPIKIEITAKPVTEPQIVFKSEVRAAPVVEATIASAPTIESSSQSSEAPKNRKGWWKKLIE
jgi:ribonuclease E